VHYEIEMILESIIVIPLPGNMEDLHIPNHGRDSLLINIIFWGLFLLLMCSVVYVTLEKEGFSFGILLVALVLIPALILLIKKKVDQLQQYTPFGITINDEGISFSGNLYHPAVSIRWEMISGFTIRTIQVKWWTQNYLKIILSDSDKFYNELFPSLKVLFGDRSSYYFLLNDVNCDPEELVVMIMNHRNKMVQTKKIESFNE
jgi:hypothetical protein